jgi:hypothetical protein
VKYLNLSSRGHLNSVEVTGTYNQAKSFNMLSNVSFLSLSYLHTTRIKEFGGEQNNYLINRKTRTLSYCAYLKNYSCCENIYQLEVFQLVILLRSCAGIKNIHHLKIRNFVLFSPRHKDYRMFLVLSSLSIVPH